MPEMTLIEIFTNLPRLRNVPIETAASVSHTVVVPGATYSPWNDDQAFITAYNLIQPNTLVDLYRCYELWSLVRQTAILGGDLLEVGVWRGGTGCLMAHRAQSLGLSSKIYLCDTFTGVVKAGGQDSHYRGGEHADTSIGVVQALAEQLGANNIEILQGIFPEDTADKITDREFSLCHIDVDVYESARDVLNWVWPRLRVGGVVVYDDYGFASCEGVTRLVNENTPKAGTITLHNLNGHAVTIKTAP